MLKGSETLRIRFLKNQSQRDNKAGVARPEVICGAATQIGCKNLIL